MNKKLLIVGALVLLSFQLSFGEALKFYRAADNMSVYQQTALKREIDVLSLQSIMAQQSDIKAGLRLINDYQLGQGIVEEFQTELALTTLLDKAKLANRIKQAGYKVEQNATLLAARQLYLAVLKAKLDTELAQLEYDNAQDIQAAEQIKRQHGIITELDYLRVVNQAAAAGNSLKLAQIEYDKTYGKLVNLLHGDVLIEVEQPRLSALPPVDYYLAQIDNRLEIQQPQLQTEIIDLDLPLYSKRFLVVRDIRRDREALLLDRERQQLLLDEARHQIKKEVQAAYLSVEQMINEVASLTTKLADLRTRLDQMELLYRQGVVSQQKLNQFKITVKQLENGYYLKACALNTQRLALQMATSVGPAY